MVHWGTSDAGIPFDGELAFHRGIRRSANPHPLDSPEWAEWDRRWDATRLAWEDDTGQLWDHS